MTVLRAAARARGESARTADKALLQLQVAERAFLAAVAERSSQGPATHE